MIPYGRQNITEADLNAVRDVLTSDFLTQGPRVPAFEAEIARQADAAHGIAVNSATSALHIACLALGLGPGDLLWTSPNTFVASANVGLLCGAEVDFVDTDPRSYCMCPDALAAKLAAAQKADRLPKVLIPVHFAGQAAHMAAIGKLARDYGVRVIEDASHAIGGRYQDQPIGNCAHSDITVFSFHPVKIITTAEGGLATTNDASLARRMGWFRSHGVTRDAADMQSPAPEPWEYDQIALGLNYRMTELQAALGLSQTTRLEAFVARRHALADRYSDLLADLPLILPWQDPDGYSALHLYPVQIDPARTTVTRRQMFDHLRASGIGVNVHYIPVHTQPYYQTKGFAPGHCPNAEAYYARTLSLPLYYDLTDTAQDQVVKALKQGFCP